MKLFFILISGVFLFVFFTIAPVSGEEGLALYFDFSAGQGDEVPDVSGNGNNGTINGKADWSNQGKYGMALAFDGKDDFVEVLDSESLDIAEAITIEAWIYSLLKADGAPAHTIARKNNAYILQIMKVGHIGFGVWDQANSLIWGNCIVDINDWETERWHHVAGVFDGKELRIYLDGVEKNSVPYNGEIHVSTDNLGVGVQLAHADYSFSGMIDELSIWSKALTPQELELSMKAGAAVAAREKMPITWGSIKYLN